MCHGVNVALATLSRLCNVPETSKVLAMNASHLPVARNSLRPVVHTYSMDAV